MNRFNLVLTLLRYLGKRARAPEFVRLRREFGRFPNDRDKASRIGEQIISRALDQNRLVVLDLQDVDVATQSFFHSLLRPAFVDRPHRVSQLVVANASEPNIAALELAIDFLIRDHNRSKGKIEARVRRYEELATTR